MATFFDSLLGRRAMELMSLAGFKEIKLEPFGIAAYPGTDQFERQYASWKTIMLNLEGPVAPMHKKLMRLGLLDEQTILSGQREIEAWHAHPHALYLQMSLLAAGRVT